MEQIISMDGKDGNLFVFPDRVILQYYGGAETAVDFRYIYDVHFRPIRPDMTGFIRPLSVYGDILFEVAPLAPGEPADSVRVQHFVRLYETIQSLRAQTQFFTAQRVWNPNGYEQSPNPPATPTPSQLPRY